jgi:hypothetical protein
MGYQNLNDNSQQSYNEKKLPAAQQRTSETERLSNDTCKCQYERLSQTGPTDQGTK